MSSIKPASDDEGLTLRQAALIAGFGMPIMTGAAPFAEYFVFPKLVIPGNIEQTVQNIVANQGLFLIGIFNHLITYITLSISCYSITAGSPLAGGASRLGCLRPGFCVF